MNVFDMAVRNLEDAIAGIPEGCAQYFELRKRLYSCLYLLNEKTPLTVDRFCVRPNEDGWGRDIAGFGLCCSPDGDLVRYSDYLLLFARTGSASQ